MCNSVASSWRHLPGCLQDPISGLFKWGADELFRFCVFSSSRCFQSTLRSTSPTVQGGKPDLLCALQHCQGIGLCKYTQKSAQWCGHPLVVKLSADNAVIQTERGRTTSNLWLRSCWVTGSSYGAGAKPAEL